MPEGSKRSRTLRRVFVKLPGGRTSLHYKKRKPQAAHCAGCGTELQGVPREVPSKIGKLSKTQRRPERPYGGVLCTACMRDYFKTKARMENEDSGN